MSIFDHLFFKKYWACSSPEIEYVAEAFLPHGRNEIESFLLVCPYCYTFGFPGTLDSCGKSFLALATNEIDEKMCSLKTEIEFLSKNTKNMDFSDESDDDKNEEKENQEEEDEDQDELLSEEVASNKVDAQQKIDELKKQYDELKLLVNKNTNPDDIQPINTLGKCLKVKDKLIGWSFLTLEQAPKIWRNVRHSFNCTLPSENLSSQWLIPCRINGRELVALTLANKIDNQNYDPLASAGVGTTLFDLPFELLFNILVLLDHYDLNVLSCTCKYFDSIINDPVHQKIWIHKALKSNLLYPSELNQLSNLATTANNSSSQLKSEKKLFWKSTYIERIKMTDWIFCFLLAGCSVSIEASKQNDCLQATFSAKKTLFEAGVVLIDINNVPFNLIFDIKNVHSLSNISFEFRDVSIESIWQLVAHFSGRTEYQHFRNALLHCSKILLLKFDISPAILDLYITPHLKTFSSGLQHLFDITDQVGNFVLLQLENYRIVRFECAPSDMTKK